MDSNTAALVRELAEKFGTTSERLFEILIRQALISGITDVIVILVWSFILYAFYRVIKRKTAISENKISSEWNTDIAVVAWVLWGFITFITAIIVGVSMSSIVAAISHPEYWAIQQLLP